ncbi:MULTISPECIES: hypothetical protein [Achromobacter]|uniref:hypothetical protein n=1 Tax=Achromobacter TaxID=222 RepID=UPI0023F8633F|nr:hypothetical protein [Achromobacter anxifer]MDF8363359.1 hypothetical protein [Achromobacter anxifer]
MSHELSQQSETTTSAIGLLICELARPEVSLDLNAALGKIHQGVNALERLSDLRATAKALLDLHQRVPHLQKATLSVAHHPSSDGSDYEFSLDYCEFIPGSTPTNKSTEELAQDLEDAIHLPIPSTKPAPVTEPIDIFAYWPEMFFNAVLGEPSLATTATVETSRDVVLEANEAGGYDEIIRTVLPISWNEVATELNLPGVEVDETTRPRPRA